MIGSLFFFFMMLSLFFWWFSRSGSVCLLMVLVFSVLSSMCYSLTMEMKVPLYMIVLTLSGGLFVLVSLVMMFFSEDYMKGVTYAKKIFFSCLIMLLLGGLSFYFMGDSMELVGGGMKVWGNFVFIYIFLILLLFLFLFVVNLIVNPSTGSMFSKKKMSMVVK